MSTTGASSDSAIGGLGSEAPAVSASGGQQATATNDVGSKPFDRVVSKIEAAISASASTQDSIAKDPVTARSSEVKFFGVSAGFSTPAGGVDLSGGFYHAGGDDSRIGQFGSGGVSVGRTGAYVGIVVGTSESMKTFEGSSVNVSAGVSIVSRNTAFDTNTGRPTGTSLFVGISNPYTISGYVSQTQTTVHNLGSLYQAYIDSLNYIGYPGSNYGK